jgi:hypothetical protein
MLQEKKKLANKMREYAMNILCEIILPKYFYESPMN